MAMMNLDNQRAGDLWMVERFEVSSVERRGDQVVLRCRPGVEITVTVARDLVP